MFTVTNANTVSEVSERAHADDNISHGLQRAFSATSVSMNQASLAHKPHAFPTR